MTNFAFLRAQWPALYEETLRAERAGVADPRTCCFYARRAVELTVNWLYEIDRNLQMPYKDDLAGRLHEPSFRRLVGQDIATKADLVRRQGNIAVHRSTRVTEVDSLAVLRQLYQVMFWLARTYATTTGSRPADDQQFDPKFVPRPIPAEVRIRRQAELAEQEVRNTERDRQLAEEREANQSLQAELVTLRKQIAQAQAEAQPDRHNYDEAETRTLFIDVMLKEVGWPLDRPEDCEYPVTGMPNRQGTGFVDYVLWGADGLPLGLVEAKRTQRDATVGQQQAKLYADCLEQQLHQRPVIFYSNGYENWIWDDTTSPPRQVAGFYSHDELALLVQRRTTGKPLAELPVDATIIERHYQHRAIRRIGEAFDNGQRDALVVMATGAGKTRTVVALADILMRANRCKRVLFLADRVALVTQTVNVFKAHLPDATTVNLVTEKNTDGRIYVSTYPTMMGLIDQMTEGRRRFGPGFFDLVVIDEAHRSVYQKYGAIFDYFDSLLVGLTATPKDEVDRNTYRLFHLEDGVPTDAYGLDEAVAEHYLVPPRPVSVALRFPREGIRYADLSDEEKDDWDSREWTEDGEVPDVVASDAVNKWLFNRDTVEKMLKTLMETGHTVAGGDRIGKTIVFARNNAHAEFIREVFDDNYPQYHGAFARVITYKTEYAQSLIDAFATPDKAPHIAISVDMLDTGIDVPDVVNLVFAKPVRSKTKFWQMLGRGTRLRPDLYGPGEDKADFLLFDFCGNLEFFNADTGVSETRMAASLAERLFAARLELITGLDTAELSDAEPEGDGTRNERGLRMDVAHTLHDIVVGMNVDNFVVRPHRRWVEIYAEPGRWYSLTPDDAREVAEHLAGLPSTVRDDDEAAKRFDLLVLSLQLSVLKAEPSFGRLRDQVREIASALLEVVNIPAVAYERELLDDVAGESWWVDVTLPMLELLRRRVRGLVRLLPPKMARTLHYTDYQDVIGPTVDIAFPGIPTSYIDQHRFEAKARSYLRAHADHVALQKLRRNRALSAMDLDELQRMLTAAGVGEPADVDRAAQQAHGLGLFIRGLIGLDRDAATNALSTFISGRTLTANQLDFVNLVIAYLTEHGVMDVGRLYDPPFTDLAPEGPEGLFSGADIDDLIAALDSVRAAATVA